MNQKILAGMYEIFGKVEGYSKAFNKKTYDNLFMEEYGKYKELFAEIIKEYEIAEDKEKFLDDVASIITMPMHKELSKCENKRKKENYLMNHNLGVVAFVIPMLKYGRNDVLDKLADHLITLWNDHDMDMKISGTTFEDLQDGFKFHLCYITTAVCDGLGKPDDCYELTLLRDYRDNYLVKSEEGASLVKTYYDIAPTIVKRISRDEHANEVYHNLWNQYLSPCVTLIEKGAVEECKDKYTEMVHSLKEKYLYS